MIEIIKEGDNHLLIAVNVPEANLDNSDNFKTQVTELLKIYKKNIIIDLNKVNYVDSSFLGALVAILKYAIAMNLDVILISLKKDVHDLLTLIRLDKIFKIYADYGQAVESL